MKIWFAANIPSDSFGGVARSMHELARGLRARGHAVSIVYASPLAEKNYLLFSLYLGAKLLICLPAAPDCIIARSTDGLFVALLCRLLRLRTTLILHNHGWEEHVLEYEKRLPRRIVTSPTTWKARLLRFSMLRLTLMLSHGCMSGTVEQVRWLGRKYPGLRGRLAYVPNGVAPAKSCFWAGAHDFPPYFLCVGGPTWKKNLEYSVAVFRRLRDRYRDARLFLVGTGVALPRGLIENEPDEANSLVNHSQVDPASMHVWYRQCPFLLAFPRYEGGHSFAILEAMSYGALAFVSPIAPNREFVRDRRNGFVLGGCSAEEDAEKIAGIMCDTDLCLSVRNNAFRSSLRHSWLRQINRLETVLWARTPAR